MKGLSVAGQLAKQKENNPDRKFQFTEKIVVLFERASGYKQIKLNKN